MEILQKNILFFTPENHQEKEYDRNNKKFIISTSGKAILNTNNKESIDFVISLRIFSRKDNLIAFLLNEFEDKISRINNSDKCKDDFFSILTKIFNIDCIKLKLGKL